MIIPIECLSNINRGEARRPAVSQMITRHGLDEECK